MGLGDRLRSIAFRMREETKKELLEQLKGKAKVKYFEEKSK